MGKKMLPKNENGSVVVLSLIMVVLLSLLGMAVSRTSSIDVQVASNEHRAIQDLYQAEKGEQYALEMYNTTWMTNGFLITPFTTAAYNNPNVDLDNNGIPDNKIEIRCIESTGAYNGAVSQEANYVPVMQHIASPPAGSKTSLGSFVVRRYGITSTSLTNNTQVQIGAYKFFNNPNN
jgi:Tfp pilus assembly protein PilX